MFVLPGIIHWPLGLNILACCMPDCNWVDTPLVIHNRADLPRLVPASRSNQNLLLLLPAVADNAAMEAEPPRADPPKRKRRWFQFSLRTMMIVVAVTAVACAYLAHEAHAVQQRKSLRQWIEEGGGTCVANDLGSHIPPGSKIEEPSLIRQWLGDQIVGTVFLPRKTSDQDLQRIKTWFPGAGLIPPGFDYPLVE